MAEWSDFFVAEVGASAALAGFVIVAISINLARIIAFPWLPGRAAETLVAPTGVLIVSSYMLVPHQPASQLAIELIATGAGMWLFPIVIQFRTARQMRSGAVPRRSLAVRFALTQISSLPIVVAGVLLWNGAANAIAWMVPGVIASLIATVINAWVLLVEIVR
jgi:modulator of FtsH protease